MKQPACHRLAIVFGAAIALTLIGANASAALPACATSISACGCVIDSSGTYSLTQALTTSSTTEDCIDIAAPNVHLETHGFAITGPGGAATNVGIKVRAAAAHADLEFADAATPDTFTVVSKFGVGIKIAAPHTTGFDFESNSNASDGLVIKGAAGTAVMDFDANSNGGDGIDLATAANVELDDFGAEVNVSNGIRITASSGVKMTDFDSDDNGGSGLVMSSSSGNFIDDFEADGNTTTNVLLVSCSGNFIGSLAANRSGQSGIELSNSTRNEISDFDAYDNGVYGIWLRASSHNLINYVFTLGNATAGVYLGCSPSGPTGTACPGVGPSSNNRVTEILAGKDGALPEAFGVAIDSGDSTNFILGAQALTDTTKDLIDENSNCDHNKWINTAGTSVSPGSCIP